MHVTTPNLTGLLAVLLAVVVLSGCAFYNHAWVEPSKPAEPAPQYDLRIVQVDDFGSFWDPDEAKQVANDIDLWSTQGNVFVCVFIHGWHNNAAPDNRNLASFKESLRQIASVLSQKEFAKARFDLTDHSDIRLVGVYIAWRGRSLPRDLDYATMWWRKEAAERVGDGDVSEFLERLERIYLRANSTVWSEKNRIIKPFTGLVTFGHSFGAQVLLKALARPIESDLIMRTRGSMADTSNPPAMPISSPDKEVEPIDSYGDLNVLLNPALEAYQFARIDSLYRKVSYPNFQTPQLLVLSATNDEARTFFFPIARVITLPFRPLFKNDYQARLFGTALGVLKEQQTHDMFPVSDVPDSLTVDDYAYANKVRDYDFTSTTTFKGSQLKPRDPRVENSPVAVALVDKRIINGHNDIFGEQLRAFLVNYVAFVEGKRLAIRHEKLKCARERWLIQHAVQGAGDAFTPTRREAPDCPQGMPRPETSQ